MIVLRKLRRAVMKRGEIQELVRDLRTKLRLTQSELASLLKVSLPTVNRWENGRTQPDALALHAIESLMRKRPSECSELLARYFGGKQSGGATRGRGRRRRIEGRVQLDLPAATSPAREPLA